MKKPYSIAGKEEGRGKSHINRFATLQEASKFIQDQWQGVEFKEGNESFHTDFCTYELRGFTFADIGKTVYRDPADVYSREFVFTNVQSDEVKSAMSSDEADEARFDAMDGAMVEQDRFDGDRAKRYTKHAEAAAAAIANNAIVWRVV